MLRYCHQYLIYKIRTSVLVSLLRCRYHYFDVYVGISISWWYFCDVEISISVLALIILSWYHYSDVDISTCTSVLISVKRLCCQHLILVSVPLILIRLRE